VLSFWLRVWSGIELTIGNRWRYSLLLSNEVTTSLERIILQKEIEHCAKIIRTYFMCGLPLGLEAWS